jgi:hypothetical protein
MCKHGGCYDCGSKENEILLSVSAMRQGKIISIAVCSKCYIKGKDMLK